jgi:hypothetical protein
MTIITRPILDLESDLFDAVNMAHIASSLIEDALGDDKVHLDLTGRPATYYIPPDSLNAMVLAIYEVESRVRRLRDQYLEAMRCA